MQKGLTLVEVLVIGILIAIASVVFIALSLGRTTIRDRSVVIKCQSNLSQLGKAICVYFNHDAYGRGRHYPDTNGGGFFARLYQAGVYRVLDVYNCPDSRDALPTEECLKKLVAEDANNLNIISYAGRKNKDQNVYPGLWRRYRDGTTTIIGSDDWQGGPNHEEGNVIFAVFLDAHTERIDCREAKGDDYRAYYRAYVTKDWDGAGRSPVTGIVDPLTN